MFALRAVARLPIPRISILNARVSIFDIDWKRRIQKLTEVVPLFSRNFCLRLILSSHHDYYRRTLYEAKCRPKKKKETPDFSIFNRVQTHDRPFVVVYGKALWIVGVYLLITN